MKIWYEVGFSIPCDGYHKIKTVEAFENLENAKNAFEKMVKQELGEPKKNLIIWLNKIMQNAEKILWETIESKSIAVKNTGEKNE